MIAAAMLSGASCSGSDTQPPSGGDASLGDGDGDGDADPLADDDGDHVCNDSERSLGTDPSKPDTDGDGFIDWVEVAWGYDPRLPSSPDRGTIVPLSEAHGASATADVALEVVGSGETFVGAFAPLESAVTEGETAATFFVSAAASLAAPSGHVDAVDGEAFRAVHGTTRLLYRLFFEQLGDARGCTRLHPFRYSVKRSDGVMVAVEAFVLVVVPAGRELSESEWCPPAEGCI